MPRDGKYRAAVLHGAGYVARDLIRTLMSHPEIELVCVSSESRAGLRLDEVHPALRGVATGTFVPSADVDFDGTDVVFSCGHHGPYMDEIVKLDSQGYPGVIVDLSANFRLRDATQYETYYGFRHEAQSLLSTFVYGLTELFAPEVKRSRRIANPGCFATGIALALAPLSERYDELTAHVVAITGASGSGVSAKQTTHFPERDGNVRAYNIWQHRHTPEILQCMQHPVSLSFVPASGPWTYGIWGVITVTGVPENAPIAELFGDAYGDQPFVRLWPGQLPELQHAARTPFCDIGWKARADGLLLVGFALDNLLKGAATAAIQNANLALGIPHTSGLLPSHAHLDTALQP